MKKFILSQLLMLAFFSVAQAMHQVPLSVFIAAEAEYTREKSQKNLEKLIAAYDKLPKESKSRADADLKERFGTTIAELRGATKKLGEGELKQLASVIVPSLIAQHSGEEEELAAVLALSAQEYEKQQARKQEQQELKQVRKLSEETASAETIAREQQGEKEEQAVLDVALASRLEEQEKNRQEFERARKLSEEEYAEAAELALAQEISAQEAEQARQQEEEIIIRGLANQLATVQIPQEREKEEREKERKPEIPAITQAITLSKETAQPQEKPVFRTREEIEQWRIEQTNAALERARLAHEEEQERLREAAQRQGHLVTLREQAEREQQRIEREREQAAVREEGEKEKEPEQARVIGITVKKLTPSELAQQKAKAAYQDKIDEQKRKEAQQKAARNRAQLHEKQRKEKAKAEQAEKERKEQEAKARYYYE